VVAALFSVFPIEAWGGITLVTWYFSVIGLVLTLPTWIFGGVWFGVNGKLKKMTI